MTVRTRLTMAVAAMALAGAACGGGASAPATGTGQGSAPAAGGQTAAAEFGVSECDDYVKAYLACVESKVPAEVRPTLRQSFDQSREAWKRAAATADGRRGLAMACTQARSAARQSMQAYGCTF